MNGKGEERGNREWEIWNGNAIIYRLVLCEVVSFCLRSILCLKLLINDANAMPTNQFIGHRVI